MLDPQREAGSAVIEPVGGSFVSNAGGSVIDYSGGSVVGDEKLKHVEKGEYWI
jgi:hypothetical protein